MESLYGGSVALWLQSESSYLQPPGSVGFAHAGRGSGADGRGGGEEGEGAEGEGEC